MKSWRSETQEKRLAYDPMDWNFLDCAMTKMLDLKVLEDIIGFCVGEWQPYKGI